MLGKPVYFFLQIGVISPFAKIVGYLLKVAMHSGLSFLLEGKNPQP